MAPVFASPKPRRRYPQIPLLAGEARRGRNRPAGESLHLYGQRRFHQYLSQLLGAESGHADSVAANFYGMPDGVATNVAHVDNYDATFLFYNIIAVLTPSNINDRVVNQSFIWGAMPVNVQQAMDSDYDDYAARYNTLFVNGAGNGNPVNPTPPATCYNGISVGACLNFINYSTVGPTLDNGRRKPDLTAPSNVTSFSTPQVAGAAAVLMQAGLRGDGRSGHQLRLRYSRDQGAAAEWRDQTARLDEQPIRAVGCPFWRGSIERVQFLSATGRGQTKQFVAATVSLGHAHPPTERQIP